MRSTSASLNWGWVTPASSASRVPCSRSDSPPRCLNRSPWVRSWNAISLLPPRRMAAPHRPEPLGRWRSHPVVATVSTDTPYEETESLLRLTLKRKLASRDLEVTSHELAVDEVTVAEDHHGCAIAALILPDSLRFQSTGATGRVRGMTRSAGEAKGGALGRTQRKRDDVSFAL